MKKKRLGIILVILFFGMLIGSALGKLIAYVVPEGVVKEFFLKSITAGFDPVTFNIGFLKLTFGFSFIINIIGIIGLAMAAYMLRWYYGHRI